MLSFALDHLPELVELVVFSGLSLVLSVGALLIERFALLTFQSGETTLGLWAAIFGAVVLGFAYLVTREKTLLSAVALREQTRR